MGKQTILLTAAVFSIFVIPVMSPLADATAQNSWLIENPSYALENRPVSVDVHAASIPLGTTLCMISGDRVLPAQTEELENGSLRLWWPATQGQGTSARYELTSGRECDAPHFSWSESDHRSAQLLYNGKPVISYEYPVYDPEDVESSKKPFHHVYSPDGTQKITKGPGGLYSHHRGIFLGYNHIFVNDGERQIDIWHAQDGERSEHQSVLGTTEGPVTGGHAVSIEWKDFDWNTFIEEKRNLRVFKLSDESLMIDVHSELTSLVDKVVLDGDRHHAGLQFRASQHVADNSEATRFIRPEGWSDMPAGSELGDENSYDFPWNAMHFSLEGQAFTVAYLSHPDNPGGAEMSERLYGRFGEFFPYELERNETLEMKYRFLITAGELSRQDIQKHYDMWTEELTIRME